MTVPGARCPACFTPLVPPAPCRCGYAAADPVSPLILPPGSVLRAEGKQAEYHIGMVLGAGGFGVTYLGWHPSRNERVAIKEYLPRDRVGRTTNGTAVRPHTTEDAALFRHGLGRFLQEAEALSQFNHPNIVRVLDFFRANATAYLVMPNYEGKTLGQHLDDLRERSKRDPLVAPRVDPAVAVGVILGVLDGLSHVHKRTMDGRRWMHRDVKPENIFLRPNGGPLLIDFGAARAEVGERSKSMSVVLTPGYAPPEQYFSSGTTQGPWVDVYGCAATLYHTVTGEPPVAALERYDAVRRGGADPLHHPAHLVPGLPATLAEAVLLGLTLDYHSRPQDAETYREVIRTRCRDLIQPLPPPVRPTPPKKDPSPLPAPRPGVGPFLLGAVATLVVLAIGVGAYWAYRGLTRPSVPNLIGKSLDEAARVLAASKLAVGRQESQETKAGLPGTVIGQHPAAGERLERGGKVNLTLAAEPRLEVPVLTGMTWEAAGSLLERIGFRLGEKTEEESADKPPGTVLGQSAGAGSRLAKGSAIDLRVAVKVMVVVPDLTGLSLREAWKLLSGAGFEASVEREKTEAWKPDAVIGQRPAGSQKAEKGSRVVIVVAEAVDVTVPDLFKMSLAQARDITAKKGLKLVISYELVSVGDAVSSVAEQWPPPGAVSKKGDPVSVAVISWGLVASRSEGPGLRQPCMDGRCHPGHLCVRGICLAGRKSKCRTRADCIYGSCDNGICWVNE